MYVCEHLCVILNGKPVKLEVWNTKCTGMYIFKGLTLGSHQSEILKCGPNGQVSAQLSPGLHKDHVQPLMTLTHNPAKLPVSKCLEHYVEY
jgi:hypothetical protein